LVHLSPDLLFCFVTNPHPTVSHHRRQITLLIRSIQQKNMRPITYLLCLCGSEWIYGSIRHGPLWTARQPQSRHVYSSIPKR
jgi:hypothetical protein